MQQQNLKTTPRAIWELTWPQMLMMFFVFCLGLCDVWTAGRLGGNIQAAFGLVTQCTMFLQVLVMAISSGAMASISQSLGAQKLRRARRYAGMVAVGCLFLGVVIAVLAYLGKDVLFDALRTPDSIRTVTLDYWSIALFTLPAAYVFASTSTLFRATRLVYPPLWIAAAMAVGNLIGNLGFGLGYFGFPDLGYKGIAWTTFGCISIAAMLNCLLLSRAGYLLRKDIPPLRWIRQGAPYLIKVALPAGASQLVWHTGYILLFSLVASLPVESVYALAGMTAGMRIEALLFLPGMAFNMTASIVVGNTLGAGNKERAKQLALQLAGAGCLIMSIIAAILWPFIDQMASALTTVPEVHAQAVSYLRYNLLSTPFTVGSVVLGGAMTGAGATRYNLIIFGTSFWAVRLPVAWVMGHFIWQDASGVYLSMLVSQIVQSIAMLWVLFHLDWTRFAMHGGIKHHTTTSERESHE